MSPTRPCRLFKLGSIWGVQEDDITRPFCATPEGNPGLRTRLGPKSPVSR